MTARRFLDRKIEGIADKFKILEQRYNQGKCADENLRLRLEEEHIRLNTLADLRTELIARGLI